MNNQKGFVMITTVLLSSVLFAAALGYMKLVDVEMQSLYASQNELKAQALSEAGVEEAAWVYNYNSGTFSSANGWTASGTTQTKTGTLTNSGSTYGTYTVTVTNATSTTPSISSVGTASGSGGNKTITTKAMLTSQSGSVPGVKVQGKVTMSDNAYTDSYNSASGVYGGSNKLTNGVVQTNATSSGAITMSGNSKIKGNAGVGTGGTIVKTDSASITGTPSTGIANTFTDNSVPSSLSALTSLGSISLSDTQTQTINAGSYKYSKIQTEGTSRITINGNVTIYLTGSSSIAMNSSSGITLASGATLTIYAAGSVSISDYAFINQSASTNVTAFNLYGLPTCTSLSMFGSGTTCGIINAPEANMSLYDNGSIYGSVIANKVTSWGNFAFHYDEHLSSGSSGSSYKLNWARRT